MKRKYKEDTPINTINKIRSILHRLGLFVYEIRWSNPYIGIYSVRLESDYESGEFGTNGKGRTKQFALASAYAEFIERLQNGLISGSNSLNRFHLNEIKKQSVFLFFPDEKEMSKQEFLTLPTDFLNDFFRNRVSHNDIDMYFDRLSENGYNTLTSIPFYECVEKKVVYLPYSLLTMYTGTNGMCAGNTNAEAIYQGLCELLERYAASIVYMERLTPPDIDRQTLNSLSTEKEIIEEIEKTGDYEVIVKDFSAGKKIPAIGVIVIHKKDKKYKLNIGCDTFLPVALSRALTEIYQGYKDVDQFYKKLLPIPEKEYDYFLKNDSYSISRRESELVEFTKNGGGAFPKSLFSSAFSYFHDSKVFSIQSSYEEEVLKIIDFFKAEGHKIYIRNVSFLGFPTFYIYVPSISGWGRKGRPGTSISFSIKSNVKYDKLEDTFFPVKEMHLDKIKVFVNIMDHDKLNLDKMQDVKMADVLKLSFSYTSYWSHIPLSYFMVNFYCLLRDYKRAIDWLELFIQACPENSKVYYYDVLLYLKYKVDNDIELTISQELIDNFDKDFLNFSSMFSEIDMPACPDCSSCNLFNVCLTRVRKDFIINMNKEMTNINISQSSLDEVFN